MSRDQATSVVFAIERDFFTANFLVGRLMRSGGRQIRSLDFRHARNAFVTLFLDCLPILQAKGVDLEAEQIEDPALMPFNALALYANFKHFTTLLFRTGVLTQDRLSRAQAFLAGQPEAKEVIDE